MQDFIAPCRGKQKGAEMKLRIAGDELLSELSHLFETQRGGRTSESWLQG